MVPSLHYRSIIGFVRSLLPLWLAVPLILSPAPVAADVVGDFLSTYCLDCHSGDEPEGAMDIEPLLSQPAGQGARKQWLAVARNLESLRMPPADADQPTEEERGIALSAIRQGLQVVDCSGPVHPGHVTIRRLTRTEYRNTIRDLFGVHVELIDEFPDDDVGHGFDNIGDVLSISPLLYEKYVLAAEAIAREVVGPRQAERQRVFAAAGLQGGRFGYPDEGRYVLSSAGTAEQSLAVEDAGTYRVRIHGYAEQAGPHWAKIGITVDQRSLAEFEIQEPSGEPFVRELDVQLDAGQRQVGISFLNDYFQPQAADTADRDRNVILDRLEIVGPLAVEWTPTRQWRAILAAGRAPRDETWTREEINRQMTIQLLKHAYRRPPTTEQVDRVLKIVAQNISPDDPPTADWHLLVTAALSSPYFLFRVEADAGPAGPAIRDLDEYELATRLSYFLWSSMPDDLLFDAAARGKLTSVAELQTQTRRMLQDPKATALVENFAEQWLQLRLLDMLQKDPQRYPQFSSDLVKSMRMETRLFMASIIQEDRSILDILDADYTYVDQTLAELYGLPQSDQLGFRRVSLAGTDRRGILTQGSVLAVTSLPTRTSPVLRGKWILENILLDPPPPAMPGVAQLTDNAAATSRETIRQQLERHRSDPQCAACHARMDSLGFALDGFDAIGAVRASVDGQPIDTTATLPDGTPLQGPADLWRVLREQYADQFVRCVVEKMFVYALGRGVEDEDECTLRAIVQSTRQQGDRFSAILEGIVASDAFRRRAGTMKP